MHAAWFAFIPSYSSIFSFYLMIFSRFFPFIFPEIMTLKKQKKKKKKPNHMRMRLVCVCKREEQQVRGGFN